MFVSSRPSRQKSWHTGRERVSVLAALALHKESVSRKLLQIREDLRDPKTGKLLSQEKAAARVGATSRTWQRWENGETVPYPRNLEAIADEFGFDVGEFFDGDQEVVGSAQARRELVGAGQLDEIMRRLDEHARLLQAADRQREEIEKLLERQSAILERIEGLVNSLPTDEETQRLIKLATGSSPPAGPARSAGARSGRASRSRPRAEG